MKNLSDLTHADKDKLITDLYELVAELRLIIKDQAEEIERLKGQISKNSQNSSKPPSTDNTVDLSVNSHGFAFTFYLPFIRRSLINPWFA